MALITSQILQPGVENNLANSSNLIVPPAKVDNLSNDTIVITAPAQAATVNTIMNDSMPSSQNVLHNTSSPVCDFHLLNIIVFFSFCVGIFYARQHPKTIIVIIYHTSRFF